MYKGKFTGIVLNNGKRKLMFNTVKETAEGMGVSVNNVYAALKNGYKIHGYEIAAKMWDDDIEYRDNYKNILDK